MRTLYSLRIQFVSPHCLLSFILSVYASDDTMVLHSCPCHPSSLTILDIRVRPPVFDSLDVPPGEFGPSLSDLYQFRLSFYVLALDLDLFCSPTEMCKNVFLHSFQDLAF